MKSAAGTPPNCTELALVKLVPVIVTEVPPREVPFVGLMFVTAGNGTPTE